MSSENIPENVELGENWRPKGRIGIVRPGKYRFGKSLVALLSWVFEALFPLFMYLVGAVGVAVFVAIMYYLCEVLPKK